MWARGRGTALVVGGSSEEEERTSREGDGAVNAQARTRNSDRCMLARVLRFRNATLVAVALALATLSLACSADSNDAAEGLYGDWTTQAAITVAFQPDGSWSASGAGAQEPFDTGTFAFEGSTLTVDTDESSLDCAGGDTGTYEVTFADDDTIEMELISDDCSGRGSDWASGLTRAE